MTKLSTHPYTWWTAALLVSIGAAMTNGIWALTGLIALCVGAVWVWHASPDSARIFRGFCYFALIALLVRLFFAALFGNPFARDALFTLPTWQMPRWLGGLTIGGDVTGTAIMAAATEGLRMAAIIIAIGAASALTPPVRLISKLPSALYEVGLAVLIALTTVPALANDVSRTQTALRLRGRTHTGLRAVTTSLTPTIDFAMRRSMTLAASMESRGYGTYRSNINPNLQKLNSVSMIFLLVFGLLSVTALMSVSFQKSFGVPVFVGLFVVLVVLIATSRGLSQRTFYRPIKWQSLDSLIVGVALAVLTGVTLTT